MVRGVSDPEMKEMKYDSDVRILTDKTLVKAFVILVCEPVKNWTAENWDRLGALYAEIVDRDDRRHNTELWDDLMTDRHVKRNYEAACRWILG